MAADRGAARRKPKHESVGGAPASPPGPRRNGAHRLAPVALDRVIHERVRLAIVSALAGVRSLSFNELKDLLDLTDGNLSVHTRRLEEAGFIVCEKTFVDRVPRTVYRLTSSGRKALNAYLDHMESLIRRVREG